MRLVAVFFGLPLTVYVLYVASWFLSWIFAGPLLVPMLLAGDGIPFVWGFLAYNGPMIFAWPLMKIDYHEFPVDLAICSAIVQMGIGFVYIAWRGGMPIV